MGTEKEVTQDRFGATEIPARDLPLTRPPNNEIPRVVVIKEGRLHAAR